MIRTNWMFVALGLVIGVALAVSVTRTTAESRPQTKVTGIYEKGYSAGYERAQAEYVKIARDFQSQAKAALDVARDSQKGWKACKAKLAARIKAKPR